MDRLRILFSKIYQFGFNKRELARNGRIEILRFVFEKTLDESNYQVTAMALATQLHSNNLLFHPDKSRQIKYVSLLLESLKISGELEVSEFGYRLSPKALILISEYEREAKMHQDTVSEAKAMKWLTIAVIIVGIIQAFVTLYGIYLEKNVTGLKLLFDWPWG